MSGSAVESSRRTRTTRVLIAAFLLISAAAIACYELMPFGQMLWWTLLGLASIVAVATGVARYRPRPGGPWLLVGGALLLETIGDIVYQALGGSVGGDGPFPSAADAIYIAVYPVAIAGLLGFVRRDTPEYRRGTLLDVLIVAVGLGALSWSVFVVPSTHLAQQSGMSKAVLVVYLLGDTLLLALALQLMLAGRLRSVPVILLLSGAAATLYSDDYFAVTELHPSWTSAPGEYIGYAAFYVAWGLAALFPSMVRLVHPPRGRPWALVAPRTWVALLCCAALISPTLLLVYAHQATPGDTFVLVGCCIALFLLVFARLVQAMRAWQTSTLRTEAQAYLHTLIADAQDAIIVVSPQGRVTFSSRSAQLLFGDRLDEGSVAGLFAVPDRERVARCFDRLGDVPAVADWPSAVRVEAGDGRIVRAEARWSDLRTDPTVHGIALTLRDVTEQRRLEEELRRQALADPLTGLMNRHGLLQRMHEDRRAAWGVGGLLLVDLDDFKDINDTLGHPIGDEVLEGVGRRITRNVRDRDAVARLGGDEFAVLMASGPDPAALETIAQRVLDAFDAPLETSAGPLRVTTSLGLAVFGQKAGTGTGGGAVESADPEVLMREADLALYAAKADGKHRWRRYDAELLDRAVHRAELRTGLDEALALGTLDVVYQPTVLLDGRHITGFEALVRWPHPTLGLLRPDSFIPLAEETGQIAELGAQILRLALRQTTKFSALRPGCRCRVGINVSVHQLRGAGFVETVCGALTETGVDPRDVVLEVTETALLDHEDLGVRARLQELRDLGVAIALDDFGTGYASLISLHDMPIDIIKIDKSFTSRITTSAQMRWLVRGVLTIAETMNIRTVAEGVETWEQHEQLVELGARVGQGYLYARPLAADEAAAMWAANRPLPLDSGAVRSGTIRAGLRE